MERLDVDLVKVQNGRLGKSAVQKEMGEYPALVLEVNVSGLLLPTCTIGAIHGVWRLH